MIKLFQTPSRQSYAYDSLSNRIITIGSLGQSFEEEAAAQYLSQNGVVDNADFEDISFPDTFEAYQEKLNHNLRRLLLEVSQQCNLRCSYCIFSGSYAHRRTHGDIYMSREVMDKAIDFYLEHSDRQAEASVAFYGGEALLCFDDIVYGVQRMQAGCGGREASFSISSNGVLLKDKVVRWLAENPSVKVTVTLNGPYHDRYRRFPNGSGSLKCILANLQKIKRDYPSVWGKQITFISNIFSLQEVDGIVEFCRELGKYPVLFSGLTRRNGNEHIAALLEQNKPEEDICASELYKKYVRTGDEGLDIFFRFNIGDIFIRRIAPSSRNAYVPGCEPFTSKLFAAADGSFKPCEKMFNHMPLGNVYDGFNWDNLRIIWDKLTCMYRENCRSCWALRLCEVCAKDLLDENGVAVRPPQDICSQVRRAALNNLRMYCDIAERHKELWQRYTTYYKEHAEYFK